MITAAGKRTAFIQIYPSTEAAGDAGDPQASWSDTPDYEVWARKRGLTQREVVTGGAVQDENTCVFEILYVSGVTTKHRIKYGDRYFDITGINDPDERHEMLMLFAREGVSYGS